MELGLLWLCCCGHCGCYYSGSNRVFPSPFSFSSSFLFIPSEDPVLLVISWILKAKEQVRRGEGRGKEGGQRGE